MEPERAPSDAPAVTALIALAAAVAGWAVLVAVTDRTADGSTPPPPARPAMSACGPSRAANSNPP